MKSPVSDLPPAFGGTLVVVSQGRPGELISRIEPHSVEGAVNQAERSRCRRGSPCLCPVRRRPWGRHAHEHKAINCAARDN